LLVFWIFVFFPSLIVAKECVFLHGTGVQSTTGPVTSFPDYWGAVGSYVSQCSSTIFIHQDTVTRPFNDPSIMQAYCDLAVNGAAAPEQRIKVNSFSKAVISNKIVFTHSFGNNVIAAAIQNGYCDFDLSTSSWYEISGPWFGSKAANFLNGVCAGNDTGVLRWLADELHYCTGSTEAPAYVSLRTNNPDLNGLAGIAQSRIKGSFCGVSPFGIPSKYSLALSALAEIVQYGQPDDGMVGINSCDVAGSFGSSPQDNFYKGNYNHADTTCRNGGTPCTWYSYRT